MSGTDTAATVVAFEKDADEDLVEARQPVAICSDGSVEEVTLEGETREAIERNVASQVERKDVETLLIVGEVVTNIESCVGAIKQLTAIERATDGSLVVVLADETSTERVAMSEFIEDLVPRAFETEAVRWEYDSGQDDASAVNALRELVESTDFSYLLNPGLLRARASEQPRTPESL